MLDQVRHGGRLVLERIEVGQRIWGWNDWTTVDRVWSKGFLPVDEIRLPMSDLRLTGDHKVFLDAKTRVRVAELQGGEKLLRPTLLPPVRADQTALQAGAGNRTGLRSTYLGLTWESAHSQRRWTHLNECVLCGLTQQRNSSKIKRMGPHWIASYLAANQE